MRYLRYIPLLVLLTITAQSCKVIYSFTGASISPEVKTASVAQFPNMSPMVSPLLAPMFNEELTLKIEREARLRVQRENADVTFEGEIVEYRSEPVSISSAEMAVMNRLTVTVRVRFVNKKEPQNSFPTDKTFTAYVDYSSSLMLSAAEPDLIPQLVEILIDDIYNAAFSNW